MSYIVRSLALATAFIATTTVVSSDSRSAFVIAHRGASAYAPEHTIDAYRLAIEQGADYVEPDLCITKDGVLVVSHDPTLERTTDVEEVFPDRFTTVTVDGKARKHWFMDAYKDVPAEYRRMVETAMRGLPDTPAALTADMKRFVVEYKVDGLFTDNPDLFPR